MLKISIIIPVYNVSLFIERCLLSVVEQRHEALEVILVDDASPDDSMEKARRFLSGYPKLDYKIVTHPQNKGLSAARNTGVKHSTGAYLYFLDSDDALPENAIAILADKAIADRPDFVMGDMRIVGGEGLRFPLLKLECQTLCGAEILHSFLRKEWCEMACNKLIDRRLFDVEHCWFYEGIVHEDNLWSFYLACKSERMSVCQEVTYVYYIQPQSITRKKSMRNIDSLCIVLETIINESRGITDRQTRSLLCRYLWNLKIYFRKSLLLNPFEKKDVIASYRRVNALFCDPLFDSSVKPLTMRLKDCLLYVYYKLRYL